MINMTMAEVMAPLMNNGCNIFDGNFAIDHHAHKKGVYHGHGRGLGGCKNTEQDTA